jgi:hypothetical protein
MATQLLPRRSQPCRLSLASTPVRVDWHLSGTGGRRGCQSPPLRSPRGYASLPAGDSSAIGHTVGRVRQAIRVLSGGTMAASMRPAWSSDRAPYPSSGAMPAPRWVRRDAAGNQPRSATCKTSRRDGTAGRDEVGPGDAGIAIPWPMWAPPTSPAKTCVVLEADSGSQRPLRRRQELCWQKLRGHVKTTALWAPTWGLVGAEGLEPPTPAL